jgi:hypothetical protein
MIGINRAVGEIKVALDGGFNILTAPSNVRSQLVDEGMELRYK